MMRRIVSSVLISTMLLGGIAPQVNAQTSKAVSVQSDYANHWAKAQIDWAIQNKLMWKNADGSFKPDVPITQSQFLASLVAQFRVTGQTPIPELNAHWAKAIYEKAKYAGFLDGITIDPNHPLTRGEMAKIFLNAWKPFYNVKKEPKGYTPGISLMVRKLMFKYPDGKLHEEYPAKRGYVATFLKLVDSDLKMFQEGDRIAQQFHNSLKISNGILSGKVPSFGKDKRIIVSVFFKDPNKESVYIEEAKAFSFKSNEVKTIEFAAISFTYKKVMTRYIYPTFPNLKRERRLL
ncbi:S-layer homology domain-containing protein [Brevibacillus sp. SYSU BS000544]|uniref:S-layer homology domain-containing protein n=1 Tax=Brevibacillus sp. SYSU BS000544 TaxID=3416443 RepID=UPI003CE5118B